MASFPKKVESVKKEYALNQFPYIVGIPGKAFFQILDREILLVCVFDYVTGIKFAKRYLLN